MALPVEVVGTGDHCVDEPVAVGDEDVRTVSLRRVVVHVHMPHAHMNAPPSAMNVWPVR